MTASLPLRRETGHKLATLELLMQAHNLVNPSSGLANDFLNQYNEILLLVENLPILLPEMVDELLAWNPKTYKEYFSQSNLPGADIAIKIYGHLDKRFVKLFEAEISAINHLAWKSIELISEKRKEIVEMHAEDIDDYCQKMSSRLRSAIDRASELVNHGWDLSDESSQEMADRLMQHDA